MNWSTKFQRLALWQQDWHGIAFTNFAKPRLFAFPRPDFYNEFYKTLGQEYGNWSDLDSGWLEGKRRWASIVSNEILPNAVICDFGCGIGFMTSELARLRPDLQIYGYETGKHAIGFARRNPGNHSVVFSDTLPRQEFDYIILASVDYALSDASLAALLSNLRGMLRNKGTLILLSVIPPDMASLHNLSFWRVLRRNTVGIARCVLGQAFKGRRNQFWGWLRSTSLMEEILQENIGSVQGTVKTFSNDSSSSVSVFKAVQKAGPTIVKKTL